VLSRVSVRKLPVALVAFLIALPIAAYVSFGLFESIDSRPGHTIALLMLLAAAVPIFYKPVYGVYLIAVEELCLVPFAIYGRSIGLIIVVLTVISTAFRMKLGGLSFVGQVNRLFGYMLVFFSLVAFSLAVNGYIFTHSKLAFNIIFFMIVISLMYIHLDTKEKLWTFLKVALVCASISAGLGIVQFFHRPGFLLMHAEYQ